MDRFLLILGAYLLGSVPFGLLIGLARGVDLRQLGSGNIGATNAGRALGRPAAVLVFLFDFLKGALPVLAGRLWLGVGLDPLLAGVAAVLGHVFPLWLRFRGGKGVATAAGAFALLAPVATAAALGAWYLTVRLSRRVAVASLVAAWALPALVLVLPQGRAADLGPTVGLGFALAVLITWRHRSNLQRLWKGKEPSIPRTTGPADQGGNRD